MRQFEAHAGLLLQKVEGLVETSPGVRSCMIEYDQRVLPLTKLLKTLLDAEQELPNVSMICYSRGNTNNGNPVIISYNNQYYMTAVT